MRLYNRRGDRLREPTAADRRLFGLVNPALGFERTRHTPDEHAGPPVELLVDVRAAATNVAPRSSASSARPSNACGASIATSKTRRDDVDEVLVDPVTALPAELNTVRAGALVSRVQMAYEPKGNGSFVRRWFRAERALADTARRVVTTIDVTNVQVVAGGGQ